MAKSIYNHTKVCPQCQEEFTHKDHRQKFCDLKCAKTFLSKKVIIKNCLQCNSEFTWVSTNSKKNKKKFCNHSCSAKYNNLIRNISNRKVNPPVVKKCNICETKFTGSKKSVCVCDICKLFCKNFTQSGISQARYEWRINNWKLGIYNPNKPYDNICADIRKYIKLKYDNKCCLCGWNQINPITGKVPVQIDHIDGNSSNNKEENLRLICPNCHSLTPTFGSLNLGNGRKSRRKIKIILDPDGDDPSSSECKSEILPNVN